MFHFLPCRKTQGERTRQANNVEKIFERICRETGMPFRKKPSLAHLGIVSPEHEQAEKQLDGSITGLGEDGAIIAYDSTHTIPFKLPTDSTNDVDVYNFRCARYDEHCLEEAKLRKRRHYSLVLERGPNLAVKVDFRVFASTTHGRWSKETYDFLKLCAETKLSRYSMGSEPGVPGSTGAPKWIQRKQVRRWGTRLAVALQQGNHDAITSGIVDSIRARKEQEQPTNNRCTTSNWHDDPRTLSCSPFSGPQFLPRVLSVL